MGFKLKWDEPGEHFYETGIEQGALYPYNDAPTTPGHNYEPGVAWNGLTNVSETPSGAEETPLYADNIKYLSLRSAEDLGLTITAYTYPDEWMDCDGSAEIATGAVVGQQPRKTFGLAYKTLIGNDVKGNALGYKLHLVYGCTASPSERGYATVNDSPEAIEFSWEVTTIPVTIGDGFNKASMITVDSRKFKTDAEKAALAALETALFGTEAYTPEGGEPVPAVEGYLPLPEKVVELLTPAEG